MEDTEENTHFAQVQDNVGKYLRSGRVDVKGLSFNLGYTRQWLCLTKDGRLLFFKDSTSVFSKPGSSISCRDLTSCRVNSRRPNQLFLQCGQRKLKISFKTSQEQKLWYSDIGLFIHPILVIEEENDATSSGGRVSCDSSFLDLVTSDFDPEPFGEPPHIEASIASRTTSSISSPRIKQHFSFLSGTTLFTNRISDGSTLFNQEENWTSLLHSEYKDFLDKEFSKLKIDDIPERPPSPIDPDVVFDTLSGRAKLVKLDDATSVKKLDVDYDIADLTGQVRKLGEHIAAGGGYSDIWRAEWEVNGKAKFVAIKVIRIFTFDLKAAAKVRKRLNRELDIWKRLKHDHIVPLYGIVHGWGRYASMVSPWIERGNASQFFQDRDLFDSIPARLKLLCEVASGLKYLHCFSPPVVHGDLKASNVLISDEGQALLTDFGISALVGEVAHSGSSSYEDESCSSFAGSVRWMAFELFREYSLERDQDCSDENNKQDNDDQTHRGSRPTTYSDVWAFGSTALEILSGKVPYYYRKNDVQVLCEIMRGMKPLREQMRPEYPSISPKIWNFLQACWNEDPLGRPSVSQVNKMMRGFLREQRRMGMIFENESYIDMSAS